MATTMKSNDSAIRAMQEMLQQKCIEEPSFALKMASPSKSMEGAINYLCQQVQKSRPRLRKNRSQECGEVAAKTAVFPQGIILN